MSDYMKSLHVRFRWEPELLPLLVSSPSLECRLQSFLRHKVRLWQKIHVYNPREYGEDGGDRPLLIAYNNAARPQPRYHQLGWIT